MTSNLLRETWTNLDSFELRLLLDERIGRPGQYDGVSPINLYLPLADSSCRIVAELEAERKLVEANRDLIARMEAKILAKLAEVWGKEENMVLP